MKSKTHVSQLSPATRSSTRAKDSVHALAEVRAEAEAAKAQLQAMQALTDTALSYLALDDLLHELLGRVTAVMGVDQVFIFLFDEDGQTLTLRAARGQLEGSIGRVHAAVGQGFPGHIAASRVPLIVNDPSASDLEGAPSILRERVRALAGVPLQVQDQVEGKRVSRLVGVLVVSSATPGHFKDSDVHLLQRAADRIALAIDRALVYAAEQDARRRADDALARALVSETQATGRAQRLHTILETIADGVAVYDIEGRPMQLVNRAYRALFALERMPEYETLTTFARARLLEMRDAATGAPVPGEQTVVARALRGEVVTGPSADIRSRALDGRELELNTSAAPLREEDGRIVGTVLVVRDMTERNRLERERAAARADELAARAASQRMEEFLATAAHDLRSPLTATVGFLALAQQKTELLAAEVLEAHPDLASRVEAVRKRMEDADQSAERLTRLLTRLFDTAAIRAGKLELHSAPCDLVALVREQVEALRVAVPSRTIRLQTPPPPEDGGPVPVVPVEADADRVGQVVANYVTNALKYSPPDQPVDVFVETRRGRARVAVRDGGPGVPKAERARVWELFHRTPGVTPQSGAQGGMQSGSLGLGLHISKAIVEAHGGRVGVKSAVGKGSTFWFSLLLSTPTPGPTDVAP